MPMPEETPSPSQPTSTESQPEQNATEPPAHRADIDSGARPRDPGRTAAASGSPPTMRRRICSSLPKAPSTHSPHFPWQTCRTPEPSSSQPAEPPAGCPHGSKPGRLNALSAPSTPMTPATRPRTDSPHETGGSDASGRKAKKTGTKSSRRDTLNKPAAEPAAANEERRTACTPEKPCTIPQKPSLRATRTTNGDKAIRKPVAEKL